MRVLVAVLAVLSFLLAPPRRAWSQLAAGVVHGVVHDPQHRPVAGAKVTLQAAHSQWSASATTGANGEFALEAVTLGDYTVEVEHPGFAAATQELTVHSGSNPILHVELQLAGASQNVNVTASASATPTASPTPTTMVDREDIERTPGAARANSLAMITDFVPGAYVTHDMLHVRGGHQTTWLIDGVPVINTAIASNVGPQFDPQDLDYVETQRGSYGAEFGDRTYGVFNAVPRTGFESNNQGELTVTAGNFGQTDDHLSFGSHTDRFAYYTSLNGNRSDLGLQTPVPQVDHDADNGFGGFGSFIFNADPANQFRLVTSARRDFYQIPYDPNPDDIENGAIAANNYTPEWRSYGLRDAQREIDAGLNVSWIHTFQSQLVLTISPFYHYNSGDYQAPPADTPVATTQNLASSYGGVQASVGGQVAKNDFDVGVMSFAQQDQQQFGAIFNDGSGLAPISDREHPSANLEAFFVDDRFQPVSWLALTVGARPTRFAGSYPGSFTESSISPRLGAAVKLPWVHWTARAFYGHYYQAPPLESVSGPALASFAQGQGLAFVPLHGEFDTEFQYGIDIPYRGWVFDTDSFRTNARNFLDHNNIGDSSIFFPITISQALIRAWEMTLRSPRFNHREQFHLAFSNQIAEGSGTITGGLTDFTVLPTLTPLDHDQRDTLNLGGDMNLPAHAYVSTNVSYGSGFTNGLPGQPYPGAYLPSHTSLDLAVGRSFGENLSAALNVLNATNQRVELDNSLTFGGFHWNDPREVYLQLDYKFKY